MSCIANLCHVAKLEMELGHVANPRGIVTIAFGDAAPESDIFAMEIQMWAGDLAIQYDRSGGWTNETNSHPLSANRVCAVVRTLANHYLARPIL